MFCKFCSQEGLGYRYILKDAAIIFKSSFSLCELICYSYHRKSLICDFGKNYLDKLCTCSFVLLIDSHYLFIVYVQCTIF